MRNPAKLSRHRADSASEPETGAALIPSWAVGVCAVAALASLTFSVLLFLNR